MPELRIVGQPWDDGENIHVRARRSYFRNGDWDTEVFEVEVKSGSKKRSPEAVKAELWAALKAKHTESERERPEHKPVDLGLPEKLEF